MAHDELNFSFAEDPDKHNAICVACGNAAEIHLSLLKGASHADGSFCFPCGEEVIRDLSAQRAEQASNVPVHATHQSFLRVDTTPDDIEHGIVFWEGQAWSSDGPFAGA